MKLARQHFGIPLVLRPEDLANSNLDELSAITYLSYFTKVGAPGYNATLQRIQPLVRNYPVFNFTVSTISYYSLALPALEACKSHIHYFESVLPKDHYWCHNNSTPWKKAFSSSYIQVTIAASLIWQLIVAQANLQFETGYYTCISGTPWTCFTNW